MVATIAPQDELAASGALYALFGAAVGLLLWHRKIRETRKYSQKRLLDKEKAGENGCPQKYVI